MPISIPVITKVKPAQLNPLKSGQRQIATDRKGAMMLAELRGNLDVISKSIRAAESDPEADPIGSSISSLIVLDCKTIADPNPSDYCVFFPEAKAGSFKNTFKEIDKVVKKGDKQIATCQVVFNGKKEGENLILGIEVLSACKMKLMPVTKWLNKLGKPYGVKFEAGAATVTTNETAPSPETATTESPKKTILDQLVERLEAVEASHINNPSPDTLQTWKGLLGKFKKVTIQRPDDSLIQQTFQEWLAKFKAAQSGNQEQPTNNIPQEDDEATMALRAKVQELEDRLNAAKANSSLNLEELVNEYSFLMGTCQQIAATPNYKAIFKRVGDLKKQFSSVLDGATAEIMNNQELKKELMRQIKEAAKVGAEFKNEAERLWEEFRDYTKTIASPLEARAALEQVEKKIQAFQKKVEERSRGLILLSKKAGVGNATKISEHMTAVRSKATKMKNAIQAQLKEADKTIQIIEKLMEEFNKTFDASIQAKVVQAINDFRKITFEI